MSGKKYKDKVEQRTKEEKKAMKAKVAAKKQDLMSELTTDVIRTYFDEDGVGDGKLFNRCLLYTSPSPRDRSVSRMPSSA